MPDLVIEGGEQLHAAAALMHAAGNGKAIRRDMRRKIKEILGEVTTEVKDAAGAIPTHGEKSTGLRGQIAHATRIEVRASGSHDRVSIHVKGSMMPAGKESLPVLMEGKKSWRHPVYGNRNNWVTQQSHPFFARTIEPREPELVAAVTAAVNEAAQAAMGK